MTRPSLPNELLLTDSETSTTTGYACYCTAESPGNITPRHHYEAAYHAWLRKARFARGG